MKSIVGVFILLVSTAAHAGIMFYPYVGVVSGRFQTTTIAGTVATSDYSGFSYGLDLGYSFSSFFLALDARGFKGSDDAKPVKSDLTRMDLGVKAGFTFGKGMEAYAEYVAKQDLKVAVSTSDVTISGTGIRLGVAHTTPKKFKFALDYTAYTFKTYKNSAGASGDIDSVYKSVVDVPVNLLVGYAF